MELRFRGSDSFSHDCHLWRLTYGTCDSYETKGQGRHFHNMTDNIKMMKEVGVRNF